MNAKILLLTTFIHQRTPFHIHVHTYIYIDTYTQCTHIHNHTCAYSICVRIHTHAHMCTQSCTYLCVHTPPICTRVAYTHTCTHSPTPCTPQQVSIHYREGHVYQALECPWDCRGGGLLRHLSPLMAVEICFHLSLLSASHRCQGVIMLLSVRNTE